MKFLSIFKRKKPALTSDEKNFLLIALGATASYEKPGWKNFIGCVPDSLIAKSLLKKKCIKPDNSVSTLRGTALFYNVTRRGKGAIADELAAADARHKRWVRRRGAEKWTEQ